MYILVHFYLRVCRANTLLTGNTAVHGGFDTLRINFFAVTAYRQINPSVSLLK